MIRAFDIACAQHWLILPDALERILAICERDFDHEALAQFQGKPLDNTRTVEKRPNGVAVVPVTGPIMRYSNLFTEISGATSTQVLATDIRAALDDPSVTGIVLNMDTPGGDARGINELSDMIHASRGIKPIGTYAGGTMASAGYWIGSAADIVVADATALLGSIGVVSTIEDTSERDAKSGKRTYQIVSSNAPNKRPDPNTEAGRAQFQAIVDAMESAFIEKVARNRGVGAEDVKANFGKGGVRVGQDAVNAGMADRLGSLESVISQVAAKAKLKQRGFNL